MDFCILMTTLSLHQPINHLKRSNKATLAIGPLRCLLLPSVNALPPSSCIFFSLLSPIHSLGTQKMKPLTILLERQSWSLAIKSFQLNQKYEGTNKNFKYSGMQIFLKITYFCMQPTAAASSLHITKGGNPHFASCSLLCHQHCTHFFSATWLSEINTCLPSTDYTKQGETKKTTQINESWKQGTYISANITCLARAPINLQQLILMQLHNIYQLASMSIAFTFIRAFDILNLISHQISHSEDKFPWSTKYRYGSTRQGKYCI